jgi:hypothetical protein
LPTTPINLQRFIESFHAVGKFDVATGAQSKSSGPPSYTAVFADETLNRDYWYYVAYAKDACGNVSPVSNEAGGTWILEAPSDPEANLARHAAVTEAVAVALEADQ